MRIEVKYIRSFEKLINICGVLSIPAREGKIFDHD